MPEEQTRPRELSAVSKIDWLISAAIEYDYEYRCAEYEYDRIQLPITGIAYRRDR